MFRFSPKTYERSFSSYDFRDYRPFYALEEELSVCVFDMPHCPVLFPRQRGVQVLGWGAHCPMGPLQSNPPELAEELVSRFGEHLAFPIEYGGDWTNQPYLERLHAALIDSIDRKKQICLDLLGRQRWDLFLTVFSEPHMALHKFWHMSDPTHPLYGACAQPGKNPLCDVYKALDTAVGAIADRVADGQADLIVFSVHGSEANCYDLPSIVFLPELLYRYSFAGRRYLCRDQLKDGQLPPVRTSMRGGWLRSVWQQKPTTAISVLSLRQWLPARVLIRLMHAHPRYQPLTWFDHRWPKMKAFALPSFGDGYVRINLKGREGQGRVSPADYDILCDKITEMLNALRNPRNGKPVVKEIIRTRQDRRTLGPHEPDADLVVVWQQPPADMVRSPTLGVLGPLPFRETGGHRPEGFLIASGQGVAESSTFGPGEVIDLAPTVLSRLGLRVPDYMDGRNLL
jgi:predicted AlkP superfamily phosphohydrolase/phosphomutase